jgi:Mce-associated membrane protein
MVVATEKPPRTENSTHRDRTQSIRPSIVAWTVAVGALAIATVVFAVLWQGVRADLAQREAVVVDQGRAEQIATDYAIGAATVNYQNLDDWIGKLKANTTPQLGGKFDATASKLEQILVPLKWMSAATPITAKVMSENSGLYTVNVFVNVNSTNAQTPEGTQNTVTYTVTVDENSGWKITDVGGADGALPMK